jgi:hypothetical protein
MSMNGYLRRFPGGDAKRPAADEIYLNQLLDRGVAGGMPVRMGPALARMPWYWRWPLRLILRKQLQAEGSGGKQDSTLDLNKSWHGLHWLLCESAWEGEEPLRSAILGGEEVGEDLGYGAARVVAPERVREVASALAMLSVAQVMKRFDGKSMDAAEIYPGGFAEDDSWAEEMEENFERLRKFYAAAAKEGDAVLSWLE